jgi:hypothetical protein
VNAHLGTARLAGLLVGAGIVAVLVLASRPTASVPWLTARASFSVATTGELEVVPASPGPVLVARSLRPGGMRSVAGFEVRNQTGETLDVGLRARPDSTALDGLLRVRLSAGGATLANTTLQGLGHGSATGVRIPSGASRRLRLEAWLPGTVGPGYEDRQVDVSLIPQLTRVTGG